MWLVLLNKFPKNQLLLNRNHFLNRKDDMFSNNDKENLSFKTISMISFQLQVKINIKFLEMTL